MTTAQVVETSVTNNSLSEDYPHPDDHAKTDTPGFKPFTKIVWLSNMADTFLRNARGAQRFVGFYFLIVLFGCWLAQ